jgi:hypothetical protein
MRSGSYNRMIMMVIAVLLLSACSTTGVNPTGLMGGQVACVEGPRQTLDCRGALQQFARDFKGDLSYMGKGQVGLGITSNKLTEADALSSDLIQHYYQTCTLYNACIISRQEYAAKMEKVQDIQLQVRRAIIGGGFGAQQSIQINSPPFGAPPFGAPPFGAPPFGAPPQGGFPSSGGFPPPPGSYPPPGGFPPPQGGAPPVGYPYQTLPQQIPQQGGAAPGLTVNIPPSQGPQDRVDTILNILREGSRFLRLHSRYRHQAHPSQSHLPRRPQCPVRCQHTHPEQVRP